MITEKDLQEAITECEGQRNPNANTCIKLAAFYTIKQHMYPDSKESPGVGYSFKPAEAPSVGAIQYNSGSEFSDLVNGRDIDDVLVVIDDLMNTLSVLNPRLYASVLRNLQP